VIEERNEGMNQSITQSNSPVCCARYCAVKCLPTWLMTSSRLRRQSTIPSVFLW